MYRKLAENPPGYLCLAVLQEDKFGVSPIDTLLGEPSQLPLTGT